MTFKERYRQFNQWQRQPVQYHKSEERHTCNNCGEDFTGNYCPTCGQKAGVGPVTWDSIRQGVMDLWGMGTRSLPYTLWQLFTRPGYLIGDYISGRRQVSFPPVKMLVIVALIVFLLGKLFGLQYGSIESMIDIGVDKNSIFYQFSQWMLKHYDWLTLFVFMTMALPTYIVFRYAPRHPYHTLPQGFFIQVFNSTQFLCVACAWTIIEKLLSIHFEDETVTILFILPLLLFYNYKQLFGYGIWGTLWRMFACWLLWILTLCLLIEVDDFIANILKQQGFVQLVLDICLVTFLIFTFIYLVLVTSLINRWDYNHLEQGRRTVIKKRLLLLAMFSFCFLCSVLLLASILVSINRQILSAYLGMILFLVLAVIFGYYSYRLYRKYLYSAYRKWEKTNYEKPSRQEEGSN
ncbi:MAG: DUF3667 domain-containing protein [Prevotella sp.]|nr:DUF3667 domain-containing protein [Prevotella sp.]